MKKPLMRKYIFYKDADIVVSKKSLRIHTTPYPLDDILYAEVRDSTGALRNESMVPLDLLVRPIITAILIVLFFGSLFLLSVLKLSLGDLVGFIYLGLIIWIIISKPVISKIIKRIIYTSYTLSIYFREGSIDAYRSNSLFYTQLISRRINNMVKRRMVLTDQLSSSEQP